ncbi:MAG: HEAT repeat domain-containing protein [Bacteroidales bacterium]|nr:HEAT repeat domain-containing protein [Bacteroidales bacterium]
MSKYSINYTKSRRWHIKAKGFRQMAQMNITEANQIIEKSLNSKNDILNGEAQLSLVQLNSETPFSFLSRLRNFFPLWNQINVHNLLTISNIAIPQFSNWLSSDNSTIVTFALRMIRYFQQQKSVNEIIGLLKHSDESVRAEAIKTLSKLGIGDALGSLKNSYEMETDRNKILIIKALQSIPDESNLKFLGELLRDIDNNVKLEAAKAIVALGPIGTSKLMMTKMTAQMENIELIPLINHALDNRIE